VAKRTNSPLRKRCCEVHSGGAIERIFSRLKEALGMSKNRFIGIEKVEIHIISCLFAYFLRYAK